MQLDMEVVTDARDVTVVTDAQDVTVVKNKEVFMFKIKSKLLNMIRRRIVGTRIIMASNYGPSGCDGCTGCHSCTGCAGCGGSDY